MEADQKHFVALDPGVAVLEVGSAFAQGFDFRAEQNNSGLELFTDFKVVIGLLVLGDQFNFFRVVYGFGHVGEDFLRNFIVSPQPAVKRAGRCLCSG